MDPLTLGLLTVTAIGAVIGGYSAHKSDDEQLDKLREDKRNIEEIYRLQKEKAAESFAQAQEEANRNATKAEAEADLVDMGADISERSLSNDFNATIDNLYLGQASDAWNWNSAAMQAGSSTGASYAALGASGVRAGSSLSDAVLMESSLNSAQLQFSQDAKRRQDNNNLGSVLNQLAGNKLGIYQNRYGADVNRDDALYLRNSYLQGGHNYNLYQNQLDLLEENYYHDKKQISNAKSSIEDNRFIRTLTGMFNGGNQALSTSYNLMNTYNEVKSYKTTLGGEK